jgi:hypothetical protein
MAFNRRQLRQLVESVLLEGFKDDQRYLMEKYPAHAADLRSLSPKWIMWLIARFGEIPSQDETHPFDDAIITVSNFARKDAAIGEKYRTNEQFKKAIDTSFPPGERKWRAPNDVASMSVDEMELILGLSERKKQRIEVDTADDIEGDRIGKVGPWNLWLPTTRENSCKIAGYDPVTLQPKTTWCTARTAGSNLFYNYIGRPGEETTLFYIIKDDPVSDTDWLALGFVNGKPFLPSPDGSLSVDRANKGLSIGRLRQILGPHHDEIMGILTEKNRELGGKHPAREKIDAATKSVEALDYLVKGLSIEEASGIKRAILSSRYEISPKVLVKLADDPDYNVRSGVAINLSTPADILRQLASDPSYPVCVNVASNPLTPPETLAQLAGHPNRNVREQVASNRSTPPEILLRLADDPDKNLRQGFARNSSTSPEILFRLAGDHDKEVRQRVASNPSTPTATLLRLADDPDKEVRSAVAYNRSTPPEILLRLADDPDKEVRHWVARHRSTPPEILAQLAGDPDASPRVGAASNRSTPPEILAHLAGDPDKDVRASVISNPSAPPEILARLVSDPNAHTRRWVAYNPATPADVLVRLAGDPEEYVRGSVASNTSTPPEILAQLAGDPKVYVRWIAAGNPSTPISALKKLLKDRSKKIKNIATIKIREREAAGLAESRLRQLIKELIAS